MAKSPLATQLDVLKYIDTLQFKTQYIKIVVLDNMDCPLRAIEGRATGGSININGSSAVRRSGSLTLVTELIKNPTSQLDIMYEVTKVKSLISMNKRIRIEIGIENSGTKYREEKIFWIGLGIFVIQDASVTHSIENGITISLKLTDKMAFLNGELGGTFTSEVQHSPSGYIQDGTQEIVKEGVKIRTLINYLLADFAELRGFEYMIDNIPETIQQMIRWNNKKKNLCIAPEGDELKLKLVDLDYIEDEGEKIFKFQEVIGYTETDFVYPLDANSVLDSKPGETIVSVLDKIKNTLGNYEYFFDVNGVFHFQAIPNFLNEGSAIDDLTKAIAEKYFFNTDNSKAVYDFKDSALVTNYSNSPQYKMVKNDFIVWGKNPMNELPIQYHLILQKAPNALEDLVWRVKVDNEGNIVSAERNLDARMAREESGFITKDEGDYYQINFAASGRPGGTVENPRTKDDDWRLRFFLTAMAKPETLRTPFDKEVLTHIPKLYDLKISEDTLASFFTPIYDMNTLSYWLDIINTDDVAFMSTVNISDFGIETIGRRVKPLNDDKVNCLFQSVDKATRKMYFIEGSEYNFVKKPNGDLEWTLPKDYKIDDSIDFWTEGIALGTIENSAYDLLRSSLHEHLSFNNNITLQALPVYHLDANSRISVDDTESDIHGDYVINSITIPLALNGMMTINARKAVERI